MHISGLIFHHVGIASNSIDAEEKNFLLLGYSREGEIFTDGVQKIRGVFLTLGAMRVEILEPISEDSPLYGFIQRGIKMYHQAFICDDLLTTINSMEAQGAHLVVPPVSAVAFGGRKISFLMLKNMMLVELIEAFQ